MATEEKKCVWATGIFLDKTTNEVFTGSIRLSRIASGASIQKRLCASYKGGKLVKVFLTKDRYSPMNWWANHPATLNKTKTVLWGDGEGRISSWFKPE
jgi:hypothetical protein